MRERPIIAFYNQFNSERFLQVATFNIFFQFGEI